MLDFGNLGMKEFENESSDTHTVHDACITFSFHLKVHIEITIFHFIFINSLRVYSGILLFWSYMNVY